MKLALTVTLKAGMVNEPSLLTLTVVLGSPVRVEARANSHVAPRPSGEPRSYSFRITAEGKTILYSGDVGSIRELDGWTRRCDLLLMENGHHQPPEVCRYLADIHVCYTLNR